MPLSPRALCWLIAIGLPLPAAAGELRGLITDEKTGEPMAGATIVAVRVADPLETPPPSVPEGVGVELTGVAEQVVEQVAISDELGGYLLTVPPGTYDVTLYYADQTIIRSGVRVPDNGDAAFASFQIDPDAYQSTGCFFDFTPPSYDGTPYTDRTARPDEVALVWRRDHRGLGMLDARGRPARAATTVDGGLRLPGAPAIALELIEDQTTSFAHAPIDQAGAAGGHEAIALVHGSNQLAGGARLALGRTSRFSGTFAGPFSEDELWYSNGIVLDQRDDGLDVQALTTLHFADDSDHQAAVAALASFAPSGGSDAWFHANAMLRDDDGKREVHARLTGESLVLRPAGTPDPIAPSAARLAGEPAAPRAVTRLGGGLTLTQRHRFGGHHTTMIGGEIGGGHADRVSHADVRAFVGDSWQVRPNWTVEAAARWDRRRAGPVAVEMFQPRLSISWDPTEIGDGVVYVAAERVALLDEGHHGAWRGGALHRDQATAGLARKWRRLLWSVAVRGWALHPADVAADRPRRAIEIVGDRGRLGVEATARWEGRALAADLTLSTLERAATAAVAWSRERDRGRTQLAAIGRATPEALAWGAALRHRRKPAGGDGPTLTLGLEALSDDDARRSAQLTLAADW